MDRSKDQEATRLFDLDIENLTVAEAVAKLDALADRRVPARVAFANAHLVNLSYERPAVREMLARFVVFNDGVGVDIARLILHGKKFAANLNGTDFVPHYLTETRFPRRIFLFGSWPGVAERAGARLVELCPRHCIVGCHHGYVTPEDTAGIVAQIRASGADLLLVGLGNPAQETWVDENIEASGCTMAIAVGAFFDFLSGEVPRAPATVRRFRLEWLYRLALEPTRLGGRYTIGNLRFLYRVGIAAVTRRGPAGSLAPTPAARPTVLALTALSTDERSPSANDPRS